MQKQMKQYIILIIGLLVMGIGIAMVTHAELGTTPIASIPYVLSFIFPLTIGHFTIFLTALFVLVQVMMLRKDFPPFQYLQLLIGLVLGYFIDLGMLIFSNYHPSFYVEKLFLLVGGCIMIALGVILQLAANTILNPADGVIKVISMKYEQNFGRLKIAFDSLQVIIAAIISFWAFEEIQGIREGTILSAFLVGFFINMIRRIQQLPLKKDSIKTGDDMETEEKILNSAISLMASKGYKAVTIKEIAAHAAVSEMTVYRQFGNKQNILDAIIAKFQYASSIKEQLEKELTYELEHDLLLYSTIYQNYMLKNKQIYMISVLERNTIPDLHLTLYKNVEEIQQFLLDYFREMQNQGKLIKGNIDSFVALFMRFNYGHFVSETLLGFSNIPISNEEFIQDSVSALVTGLSPKGAE